MRARDEADGRTGINVFPRFMVWENVIGAFSSNGGEDFRAVLEETCRVAEPTASVPRYEGGGGQTQELLSETDIPSLGELTTRNIGEYPRGGVASLWSPTSTERLPRKSCLSAILETNPNPKYNLSPTACLGILRRAVRRGKISTMPKILIRALQRQAGVSLSEITMTEESSMTNLSRSTLVGGDRQPIIFKRG